MTREEIASGIERLGPWFHMIDFGQGLQTKTASSSGEPVDHPMGTWQIVQRSVPADLSAKRVLDVGCNGGFYSIEMKRRGAAHVLGVDVQRHHVRQTLFAGRALGMDIQARRLSVYDLTVHEVGTFDITLALGLIYHCKHPVLALERLYGVTSDLLIVESAILPAEAHHRRPFETNVGGNGRTHHPIAYVENAAGDPEAVYNWFLPSAGALVALLRTVGFTDVSLASVDGPRAVVTARKPKGEPQEVPAYGGTLLSVDGPESASAGSRVSYRVVAENTGSTTWSRQGSGDEGIGAVKVGAHLFSAHDDELSWDYARATLDRDVAPGQRATVELEFETPSAPGSYRLEFDLVAEHVTWFENLGLPTVSRLLSVA